MPVYRIGFSAGSGLPDELLQAERLDVEGGTWLVFRAMVLVIGAPREVVVRRLAASAVATVTQVVWPPSATAPSLRS